MATLDSILQDFPFLSVVQPFPGNLIGREEETNLLLESLLKRRFKNTILVGEAGCGKTSIIENLAGLVANKNVILDFSVASSLTSTKYRGEFEEKVVKCFNEILKYNATHTKKIILFIDEIHTIMKAGDTEGALSLANILKPYLSKLDLIIIGATTTKEYEMTISRDLAIKRRLSPIYVGALSGSVVLQILSDFCEGKVPKGILEYIYAKSKDIPNASNPDIAIEILDRCLARQERLGLKQIREEEVDELCQSLSI